MLYSEGQQHLSAGDRQAGQSDRTLLVQGCGIFGTRRGDPVLAFWRDRDAVGGPCGRRIVLFTHDFTDRNGIQVHPPKGGIRGMQKRIATISREFGSGGRSIGRLVAQQLGVAFYDKELVKKSRWKPVLTNNMWSKKAKMCQTRIGLHTLFLRGGPKAR